MRAVVKLKDMAKKIIERKIDSHVSDAQFRPTNYLAHPFLQSVFNVYEPLHEFNFRRQRVFMKDGGHVALDWSSHIDPNKAPPVLFIVHGITGGSDSNYIRVLTREGQAQGFQCVVLNNRGINTEMTSPMPFTGLSFQQINQPLKLVEKYYPKSQIFLLGTSFGGNYLIRYLTAFPKKQKIKALIVLSPPFDIKKAISDMAPIYQKFFVKRYFKQTIFKHQIMQHWEDIGLVDMSSVKKSKDMVEFHTNFTAKMMVYSSSDEVFSTLSIKPGTISTFDYETLYIMARDDPIVSFSSMPHQEIKANKKIKLIVTDRGGHLCWFSGIYPKRWYPLPIFNYINSHKKKSP